MSEDRDRLDTPEGRIFQLASSLYYVAQIDKGYDTQYVFDALPRGDQKAFEAIARLAIEAAASWRLSSTWAPPVAPPEPVRPALRLVPREPEK